MLQDIAIDYGGHLLLSDDDLRVPNVRGSKYTIEKRGVKMMSKTIIPFGPQHPVLPEPIHLKLVMEDEKIVEAIPAIGYVHRGLEKLTETKEFTQNVYVVERICGICSVMHAMAYCQGIEELMNIEVPDRAKVLKSYMGRAS